MKTKTTLFTTLAALGCAFGSLQAQNQELVRAYTGSTQLGFSGIEQLQNFNSANLDSGRGVAAGVAYREVSTDDDTDRLFEADLETGAAMFGYSHAFEPVVVFVSAGFLDVESQVDRSSGNDLELNMDGDGWLISVGAAKQWDAWSLMVQGGVGELSLDGERTDALSVNDLESGFDTEFYFISARLAYQIAETSGFTFTPFLELGYRSGENDQFSESTGPSQSAMVESFEDEVPYSELGLRVGYTGWDNVVLGLDLSWWQDLGDDEIDVEWLNALDLPVSDEVPDPAQTLFKASVHVDVALNESWNLRGNVNLAAGDDVTAYGVGAAVGFAF